NQNGNQNGAFRISLRTSASAPSFQTGNISPFAAASKDVDPFNSVQDTLEQLPNVGVGNVLVDGPDGGPYVVTFVGALANKNFPLMTIQNININGAPNFQVQAIQDGGILGSATASLENALNSLPSKPANLTF